MNIRDINYLNDRKAEYPEFFKGSKDINGSVRQVFDDCDYVGVDWVAGQGVDIVCLNHDTKFDKQFDVLISYSTFEHDFYWDQSIEHNLQWLRNGGLILFSWAGLNSSPHCLECASDMGTYKEVERKSPEWDAIMSHYYPKSLEQMVKLLIKNNIRIIDTMTLATKEIGTIHYLTAIK
jgi:SAM-dependent methyltransferase